MHVSAVDELQLLKVDDIIIGHRIGKGSWGVDESCDHFRDES